MGVGPVLLSDHHHKRLEEEQLPRNDMFCARAYEHAHCTAHVRYSCAQVTRSMPTSSNDSRRRRAHGYSRPPGCRRASWARAPELRAQGEVSLEQRRGHAGAGVLRRPRPPRRGAELLFLCERIPRQEAVRNQACARLPGPVRVAAGAWQLSRWLGGRASPRIRRRHSHTARFGNYPGRAKRRRDMFVHVRHPRACAGGKRAAGLERAGKERMLVGMVEERRAGGLARADGPCSARAGAQSGRRASRWRSCGGSERCGHVPYARGAVDMAVRELPSARARNVVVR
jgi:hypothetical protein